MYNDIAGLFLERKAAKEQIVIKPSTHPRLWFGFVLVLMTSSLLNTVARIKFEKKLRLSATAPDQGQFSKIYVCTGPHITCSTFLCFVPNFCNYYSQW